MKLNLPIYEALWKHQQAKALSFHVPGHKNGQIFEPRAMDTFESVLKIDATEITGLDDLHAPEGIIKKAQELTANLYNVKESYFLVGGSTSGNLAMIAAACQQGDTVFVQRNCHKSILHALQLMNVKPIFLHPEIDEATQTPIGVTHETLTKALKAHPCAAALVLTYPSYYGFASSVKELIMTAHDYGLTVLVDEAHGAHFIAGEPFPPSSLSLGADVVVHSAHKTLPAMTMGSFLHINSERIDKERLVHYLQVFQSSSPSYPIMASLDIARSYLETVKCTGSQNEIVAEINYFKKELEQIGFVCANNKDDHFLVDPLKVILQAKTNGYELQRSLEKEQIYPELADPINCLLILPLNKMTKTKEILPRFKRAMLSLEYSEKHRLTYTLPRPTSPVTELVYSYNEIQQARKIRVSLEEAVGKVCAEMVIPYPPGVALLMAGEQITSSHLVQITKLNEVGARFHNHKLWSEGILVVEE